MAEKRSIGDSSTWKSVSYTFVLVVRKKYVNGFYPSAGNVLTSEMYLVNANFGSNSKDIEIGKKKCHFINIYTKV